MTTLSTRIIEPRLLDHGKLLLTSGIQHWLVTGIEPWADAPKEDVFDETWRRHYLSVIVTSHIHGDAGDTDDQDHLLNFEAFANPGDGFRVFTVWDRNKVGKIYAITSDYGGPDAYLTVMFAGEY
ncbi:hypothetical protein [Synechococcus sp. UW179B]|jgi:hypothetical protein|uniref:hypothetical protein n=1 Tax=Synechococcus sp. UW179B TaxID=2575516 RepID=UPI000E0F3CD4|nr:hypothetical protein [Synechococcus sp. UW179B]